VCMQAEDVEGSGNYWSGTKISGRKCTELKSDRDFHRSHSSVMHASILSQIVE
jgi:hypothetical protein